METRANYATIGIFTLIVIALTFGFIYWLKRYDEAGQRVNLPLEFVGTVNGLAKGGAGLRCADAGEAVVVVDFLKRMREAIDGIDQH